MRSECSCSFRIICLFRIQSKPRDTNPLFPNNFDSDTPLLLTRRQALVGIAVVEKLAEEVGGPCPASLQQSIGRKSRQEAKQQVTSRPLAPIRLTGSASDCWQDFFLRST